MDCYLNVNLILKFWFLKLLVIIIYCFFFLIAIRINFGLENPIIRYLVVSSFATEVIFWKITYRRSYVLAKLCLKIRGVLWDRCSNINFHWTSLYNSKNVRLVKSPCDKLFLLISRAGRKYILLTGEKYSYPV